MEMRWHGVLAAAYKSRASFDKMVAHLCNDRLEPVCKRVPRDHICDEPAQPYEQKCPRCLKVVQRGMKET